MQGLAVKRTRSPITRMSKQFSPPYQYQIQSICQSDTIDMCGAEVRRGNLESINNIQRHATAGRRKM